ncbi:MAG: ATP-binding protein [Terriglobales bacterium]
MSQGITEARLRLAYINQYRELALAILFALALSLRVLGSEVPTLVLVLLGLWALLAWAFVQVSAAALDEVRLNRLEFSYFACELSLITAVAHFGRAATWLALLFYVVTILYATMVLPRRSALWVTALAAANFTLLLAVDRGFAATLAASRQPAVLLAAMGVGTLIGYALIGLSLAQFSLTLNRQAEALQAANRELNATGQELRLHRDHLESLVRERTRELEQATDDLRRINADLRRLNELKSSFLASVSHELRTPLTSIRSFSEILLRYPDEEMATRCEFLEIIIHESDRLTRLINDVLDLAKIEAGKIELRPQPVRIADLVRESLDVVQVMAAQKGLSLRNWVEDDLPLIPADPDRLRQVFANLLSNAIKFTDQGAIEVGAHARDGELLVYVSDTGVGLPLGDEERIFDKFHQHGNALTDKPAGTGLGLAICREICQRHGGRIWAARRQRGGSIFYVALPLLPMAVPAATGA